MAEDWSFGDIQDSALERVVEEVLVLPLLYWLGWQTEEIAREVAIRIGREKKVYARADFVVWERAFSPSQNVLVVEAKRPGESLTRAAEQARTYANSLSCPYFVITDGRRFQVWATRVQRGMYTQVLACRVDELECFSLPLRFLLGANSRDRVAVARRLPEHPALYQFVLEQRLPTDLGERAMVAALAQDAETLADLLTTHMRLKSIKGARVSDLTLAHYSESARRFLTFTGPPEAPQRHLTTLEPEDFELWMLTLERDGLSPNSIKRHLYGVRNLMRALVWAGVLENDPSAGVRPPADPSPAHARKGALPLETYRELLTLPATRHGEHALQARRDLVLLLLGGHAGLRAAEIVGLELGDLDLTLSQLQVRGKGQKLRVLPIGKTLSRALSDWLTRRAALLAEGLVRSEAVLLSLSGLNYGGRLSTDGARFIAEGYYKEAGLPPRLWGLHTLRRTAGTHLYRATRDLHVVADILGHASVSTSAIYAKMDVDVRREAIERLEELREG